MTAAPFAGWQIQADWPIGAGRADRRRSRRFAARKCMVQGAGRTDAGVHALGQVAHFDLAKALANRHRARRAQRASASASGRHPVGREACRTISMRASRRAGGIISIASSTAGPILPLDRVAPGACRAARRRCDACGRAAACRPARFHDVPLDRMPGQVAGEDARPARRASATATRCTS